MRKLFFFAVFLSLNFYCFGQKPDESDLTHSIKSNAEQKTLDSLINIGNTYWKQGEIKKSVEYYNMAIDENPNFARAYYNRGNSEYALGLKDKACKDWEKAKSLGHKRADEAIKTYCK